MENRHTALPVFIAQLDSSQYVQSADEPSGITLPDGKVAGRVRIYGLCVSTNELVVDDGTGSIVVRSFDKPFTCELGSPILVIGRPRTYNNELYILGEIVKTIDPKWIELHKKLNPFSPIEKKAASKPSSNAIDLVRKHDTGEGADYTAVVNELGPSGEEMIVHLLAIGELFETKPGKLKVLE